MKNQFKTIAAVLALGMVGYAAYAETVTVSTFYPSPYGSYTTLDVATLQGVGGNTNIWVQPGTGNVGVGFATPTAPASKLDVRGGHIRAADSSGGTTAYLQGTGTAGAGSVFMGALNNRPVNIGNTDGTSTLIVDNNRVGIGGAPTAEKLNVVGSVRLTDPGNQSGVLQLDCDGANCYAIAVYS